MKHIRRLRRLAFVLAVLMLLSATVFAVPAPAERDETETAVREPEASELLFEDAEAAEIIYGDPEDAELPAEAPESELPPEETAPVPDEEPEVLGVPVRGEPEPSPREMTDEQIIEKYGIADNWARPALIFAVRTGLLSGKGDAGLCPKDNTTRAEFAAMIVRIAGTTAEADLSAFTDVSPSAWYYKSLARAKALGVISGTSDTKMSPNANVTREQVFAMLARFFGIKSADKSEIYSFSDWKSVSGWAGTSLSAMIKAGYVSGSGGKLNPKGNITRQEVAQVFYKLLDDWYTELPASFDGNFALAADTVASGTVVNGDLLLSNGAASIALDNVKVTGRLVIQGVGPVVLSLNNCDVQTLVLCRDATLTMNGCGAKVVSCANSLKLTDDADALEVWSGTAQICAGAQVNTVDLMTEKAHLIVDGTADTVNVRAKDQVIDGSGQIQTLNVYAEGLTLNCAVGTRKDIPYTDLDGITAKKREKTAVTFAEPEGYVSFLITNVPVPDREYTVSWEFNGKVLYERTRMLLREGSVVGATLNLKEAVNPAAPKNSETLEFVIRTEKGEHRYPFTVDVSDSFAQADRETKAIRAEKLENTVATVANPIQHVSVKLTNIPSPAREYTVGWYLKGKAQFYQTNVVLKEGDVIGADVDFSEVLDPANPRDKVTVYFAIRCNGGYCQYAFSADVSDSLAEADRQCKAIQAEKLENTVATVANPTQHVSVKLTNIPSPAREYTVGWYLKGKPQFYQTNVVLKEGDVIGADVDFSEVLNASDPKKTATVYFVVRCTGGYRQYPFTVDVSDSFAQADRETKAIRAEKLENTVATMANPIQHVSVKLTNIPSPAREYTVGWYLKGKAQFYQTNVVLKEGDVIEADVDFSEVLDPANPRDKVAVYFAIRCNGGYCQYAFSADVSDSLAEADRQCKAIQAEKLENTVATVANPTQHVSVKLTNIPSPAREYTVGWYLKGKAQFYQTNVVLKEGDVIGADVNFSEVLNASDPKATAVVYFVVRCKGGYQQFPFAVDTSDIVRQEALKVRTQNVQATALRDTTMYGSYALSGTVLGTLSKDAQVTYITYSKSGGAMYSAYVRTKEGKEGWVKFGDISVSNDKFYVTWDYSKAVKEYWINNIKQASSSYQYLIWISLYTQRVNIFQGSKGNWELIHSFPCASGTNDHTTRVQDTKILYKTERWNYADFYVDHVSGFDNQGRAFHSRLKNYADGSLYNPAISYPASHGCVRMLDDGLQFIWDNCPIGTTVIVY